MSDASNSSGDAAAPVKSAKALIHDLGYSRYGGRRKPQRTRYQVIVRNVIAMAWRGWWRSKMWLIGSGAITVGFGMAMYFLKETVAKIGNMGGFETTFADFLLPMQFEGLTKMAFLLSMTVLAGSIARDLGASAFEFYFSRPVRPIDYVLGKVGGSMILMGIILVVCPIVLGLTRLGMGFATELSTDLIVVPKMAFVGLCAAVPFTLVPLAISSLTTKPRNAIIIWGAYYIVVGSIIAGVANLTKQPMLALLDMSVAIGGVIYGVFDVQFFGPGGVLPPLWASALAVAAYSIVAFVILYMRAVKASQIGIGGK